MHPGHPPYFPSFWYCHQSFFPPVRHIPFLHRYPEPGTLVRLITLTDTALFSPSVWIPLEQWQWGVPRDPGGVPLGGSLPLREGGAGGTCQSVRGPLMWSCRKGTDVNCSVHKKRLQEYSRCTSMPVELRNTPEFLPEYVHSNTNCSNGLLFFKLYNSLLA